MKPTSVFFTALTVAFLLVPGAANGQEKKAPTAQQERMKGCNAEASSKGLKGRDRQAFMSSCLKAGSGEKKRTARQERMKSCNAQASSKDLKGEERKKFMSSCLKG